MLIGVPSVLSFDCLVACCVMVGYCSLFGVECWLSVVIVCVLYGVCCVVCVVLGCRVMVAVWCSLWCFVVRCVLRVVCSLSFVVDVCCVLHGGCSVRCLTFVCWCMALWLACCLVSVGVYVRG